MNSRGFLRFLESPVKSMQNWFSTFTSFFCSCLMTDTSAVMSIFTPSVPNPISLVKSWLKVRAWFVPSIGPLYNSDAFFQSKVFNLVPLARIKISNQLTGWSNDQLHWIAFLPYPVHGRAFSEKKWKEGFFPILIGLLLSWTAKCFLCPELKKTASSWTKENRE